MTVPVVAPPAPVGLASAALFPPPTPPIPVVALFNQLAPVAAVPAVGAAFPNIFLFGLLPAVLGGPVNGLLVFPRLPPGFVDMFSGSTVSYVRTCLWLGEDSPFKDSNK